MSQTVRFTFDGQDGVAESDLTIWELPMACGLVIPHLYHNQRRGVARMATVVPSRTIRGDSGYDEFRKGRYGALDGD